MELEVVMTILKFAGVFVALSFVVFWIGLVWWVSQDVVSRTNDKIILALSVALASIFGPIGVLLYLIVRPRQTIRETYREMLETEINRKLASLDMAYCPFCGANLEQDADKHEVHPRQLSMADLEQLAPAKSQMTDEVWVEEFQQKESALRRLIMPGAKKISGGGKAMGVEVARAASRVGKATVQGAKFLLTPLPQQMESEVVSEPKAAVKSKEALVESEVKEDDLPVEDKPRAESAVKPAAKKSTAKKSTGRATSKKTGTARRRAKK